MKLYSSCNNNNGATVNNNGLKCLCLRIEWIIKKKEKTMMMEKKKNKKKKIKVNIEGSMLQKCNWWRRNVDVELCTVRNFSVNVCVTLYFTSSIPWYCDINPYSNNVNNGRKTYTCFDANVWRMTDNWNWQFHHTTNIRILGCSWKWRWNESAFVDDCTSVFPFKLLLLLLFF